MTKDSANDCPSKNGRSWFIDEEFLKRLAKLRLVARKGGAGPDRGAHRSRRIGEGLEFMDYRKYHPGDDLRYVDWSVYGRLDKLFIKLFHVEENQTVHILVDTSRSMGWGAPPKHINAKKIAAAISYVCLSNFDKVILGTFSDAGVIPGPAARSKNGFAQVLEFLQSARPLGGTDVNGCLAGYAGEVKTPGIVIVVSDLFDPGGYRDGFTALTCKNIDIHLIQVLDHQELDWHQIGNLVLTEVESGVQKTLTVDRTLLERYRQRIQTFLADIQGFCDRYRIGYYLHDTSIPFEGFLTDYLARGRLFR